MASDPDKELDDFIKQQPEYQEFLAEAGIKMEDSETKLLEEKTTESVLDSDFDFDMDSNLSFDIYCDAGSFVQKNTLSDILNLQHDLEEAGFDPAQTLRGVTTTALVQGMIDIFFCLFLF